MAKLYIICGHGAGDPGAVANGYKEAERVRWLALRMKDLGGKNVVLLDTSRNWYADGGINSLTIPSEDCLLELHMDSAGASARGGHVIIYGGFDADEYDKALAAFIADYFPGRSVTISKRKDLANPNRAAQRGINYRLLETCFISNAADLAKFNAHIDEVAAGILGAFGIKARIGSGKTETAPKKEPGKPVTAKKTIAQLADEVIAGLWGNGEDRKKRLQAAGYDYAAVQAAVNEKLLGAPKMKADKSIDQLAIEVIRGDWGNGEDRKKRLTAAGYDYAAVQRKVNELL